MTGPLRLALLALLLAAPAAAQTQGDAGPARAISAAELRAQGGRALADLQAALPAGAPDAASIRPAFDLTDQTGARRSPSDFAGRAWAVFFGYVADQSICSIVLPRIAGAAWMLEDAGIEVTPVVVTIDPERDTPAAMAAALPRYHPRLVGLTGDPAALEAARDAFQVKLEQVGVQPDGKPLYIHGNIVYLVGPDGRVRGLLPPLASPARMAEAIAALL